MKKIVLGIVLFVSLSVQGQKALKVISAKETERVEGVLASDEMEGRKTFSSGIEKAAAFIASEFEKNGLQHLNGEKDHLQRFSMIRTRSIKQHVTVNGKTIEHSNLLIISTKSALSINEQSGYDQVVIGKGVNFINEARKALSSKNNTIVFADTSYASTLKRLERVRSQIFSSQPDIIFVLTTEKQTVFSIEASQEVIEMPLSNIVGIIPGKTKPNEYVIFSAHYDHLGISTRNMQNNDSIYNGANDDAAGTAAVIMLSKYFKKLNNNERTLVFAAFTAEEIGGFGSQHFSRQFDPSSVVAMFNIEMIGTESKWGKNSAYITGFEKTDMGSILQKNLENTGFTFHPDPYPDQQLFYRSDNATLARLGVPAHTISTSKMDNEPNYHKASDEISTIDLQNMTAIIKAIAISSRGIVSGKETPTRVDTSALK
ncbi:MAG: M28 family metallopeptidase [bacterium]